jgi:hypothetical protein
MIGRKFEICPGMHFVLRLNGEVHNGVVDHLEDGYLFWTKNGSAKSGRWRLTLDLFRAHADIIVARQARHSEPRGAEGETKP